MTLALIQKGDEENVQAYVTMSREKAAELIRALQGTINNIDALEKARSEEK